MIFLDDDYDDWWRLPTRVQWKTGHEANVGTTTIVCRGLPPVARSAIAGEQNHLGWKRNVYLSFVFRFRWWCSSSTFHNSFATKPLSANPMHDTALYNSFKTRDLRNFEFLSSLSTNASRYTVHWWRHNPPANLTNLPILSSIRTNFWVASALPHPPDFC